MRAGESHEQIRKINMSEHFPYRRHLRKEKRTFAWAEFDDLGHLQDRFDQVMPPAEKAAITVGFSFPREEKSILRARQRNNVRVGPLLPE